MIRALNRSIKELEAAIAAHLGEHPDAVIFTSLPRSGRPNAAQMLAEELADLLARGPAGRIVLELTEHQRIHCYEPVLEALDKLRRLGVRVATLVRATPACSTSSGSAPRS